MPEPTIPTGEELETLPRWARVAFAAHCARRCQSSMGDISREIGEEVELAISAAEEAARLAKPNDRLAEKAANLREFAGALAGSAFAGVHAAAAAAAAAAQASAIVSGYGSLEPASYAADAAMASAAALNNHPDAVAAIRRDFDGLAQKAENEKWDEKTGVPEAFGFID